MKTTLIALALLLGFGLVGCTEKPISSNEKQDKSSNAGKGAGSKHDGWWCDEHGLPEEECWACSDKYCQKCKKSGDWCETHERPKSQCFKCDPKLKNEWAKKYAAKYGKEPPVPDDY